ncbi:MAG: dihydrolipoamide acetyltransferase family protein [Nakamurella sp.]
MSHEVPFYMPKMSMTMETGELVSWLKQEGDVIRTGDVICEVATDKVDMEVESTVDGTIARIVARPGDTVPVGQPIAFISTEADDLMAGLFDPAPDAPDDPATPGSDAPADVPTEDVADGVEVEAGVPSRRGPQPAVPFARRRASQLRVSLVDVIPTGRNGIITVQDVELAAAARDSRSGNGSAAPTAVSVPVAPSAPTDPPAPAPAPTAPPAPAPTAPSAAVPAPTPPTTSAPSITGSGSDSDSADAPDPGFADLLAGRRRSIRTAVARTMSASAVVPQFTVFAELDLEAAARVRNGIGWTTLLVRGLARALRGHPTVNAGWDDTAQAPAAPTDVVGVSLAVESAVGLLAPVVRDPDLLSIDEQDGLIRATIARARTGKLSGADLRGGTTTLSNLGGFGVPSFTSLLTPPQATALSVGAISLRPVVVGGGLAVRLGTTVGLTLDHRPVDGVDGARVLADLQELFRHPEKLLR